MANLSKEFLEYYEKIDLTKPKETYLKESRDALRSDIKDYFTNVIQENQPKFYIQGSMAMGTTVNPLDDEYDIDDGIYLQNANIDYDNEDTWPTTIEAHEEIVKAVSKNGRTIDATKSTCVRVVYAKNYHVDLPIYIKNFEDENFIPKLAHKKSDWTSSDPLANTNYFLEKRKQHGDILKRIVMYLKGMIDSQKFDYAKNVDISGFELTLLACRDFSTASDSDRDDLIWHQTIEKIYSNCSNNVPLCKPVTNEDLWNIKSEKEKKDFLNVLEQIIINTRYATQTDSEKEASEMYQLIFGSRFPLVEDKTSTKQPKPVVIEPATSG